MAEPGRKIRTIQIPNPDIVPREEPRTDPEPVSVPDVVEPEREPVEV